MSETKMTPETLAAAVDQGPGVWMVDEGAEFASDLASSLKAKGWKHCEALSRCKVASREYHLRKGTMKVEVIASNFMGAFVDVHVWSAQ